MKNTTTLQSKRSITVLLGVLLYFSSLSAQTMQDTIIANFSLMERIPKEKLYLHLDKPFYGAGEKIWFKGYLVNAITHQDNAQSNFIITELINRSDSIVERKKIRRDSLGFHINPEKPDVPLNKNDAFQKVQKRHVQEKR